MGFFKRFIEKLKYGRKEIGVVGDVRTTRGSHSCTLTVTALVPVPEEEQTIGLRVTMLSGMNSDTFYFPLGEPQALELKKLLDATLAKSKSYVSPDLL